MSKWIGAHVGEGSPQIAVRVTSEEKDRLEQLRKELQLTSKGQVIRAALDLLEGLAVTGDTVAGHDPENSRRAGRRLRRHHGVPRSSDLDAAPVDDAVAIRRRVVTSFKHVRGGELLDAERGLSASAPAAPAAPEVDDRQLELPEMPPRSEPADS